MWIGQWREKIHRFLSYYEIASVSAIGWCYWIADICISFTHFSTARHAINVIINTKHTPFSSVRPEWIINSFVQTFHACMHINIHRCDVILSAIAMTNVTPAMNFRFSQFFFPFRLFAPWIYIIRERAGKLASKQAIISIGIELRVICLFIYLLFCEKDSVRFVAIRWQRIGMMSEIRKTIHDYVIMKIENKKKIIPNR